MFEWVQDNWIVVSSIALNVVNLFGSIAKATKNKKDDAAYNWVNGFLSNFFSLGKK